MRAAAAIDMRIARDIRAGADLEGGPVEPQCRRAAWKQSHGGTKPMPPWNASSPRDIRASY